MADTLHILDQLCDYIASLEIESYINLLESPNTNLLILRNNEGSNRNNQYSFPFNVFKLFKRAKCFKIS